MDFSIDSKMKEQIKNMIKKLFNIKSIDEHYKFLEYLVNQYYKTNLIKIISIDVLKESYCVDKAIINCLYSGFKYIFSNRLATNKIYLFHF